MAINDVSKTQDWEFRTSLRRTSHIQYIQYSRGTIPGSPRPPLSRKHWWSYSLGRKRAWKLLTVPHGLAHTPSLTSCSPNILAVPNNNKDKLGYIRGKSYISEVQIFSLVWQRVSDADRVSFPALLSLVEPTVVSHGQHVRPPPPLSIQVAKNSRISWQATYLPSRLGINNKQ